MKIKIRNFDRQYNANQMSGGNGSSFVPSNQHQEMLTKLEEKFNSKKTNRNSGYEIGQIRLFRNGISGMTGGKQITSYKKVLTTHSGDVSVRCDSDYRNTGNSGDGDAGVVDRSDNGTYYNVGSSQYIYPGDSTTGRYDSLKGDHDNYLYGGSGDKHVAAGYRLYVMEYVGGNYYYDKLNDIEYGTPSKEGLETERQKKENVYKLKI